VIWFKQNSNLSSHPQFKEKKKDIHPDAQCQGNKEGEKQSLSAEEGKLQSGCAGAGFDYASDGAGHQEMAAPTARHMAVQSSRRGSTHQLGIYTKSAS